MENLTRHSARREAIILAGGMGTRLRGVVADRPKCMATVAGRPFLYYILRQLSAMGMSHVVLALGYHHEQVEQWIDPQSWPFRISFSVETEPLGTGGAIRQAMNYTSADEVFVVNGDTYFDIDPDRMEHHHRHHDSQLTMALKPMCDFSRYGVVECTAEGRITAFHEKQPCAAGCINGGVYLLDRRLPMDRLPERFSFENDLMQARVGEIQMYGIAMDGYFIDIGIPDDYFRAQEDFAAAQHNPYARYDTLLLDRDGVINRLRPGDYVKSWSEFEFLPGTLRALRLLADRFGRIYIVTNQRGVGRGLMSCGALNELHERMIATIRSEGGRIDAIYCCTDTDDRSLDRKPNTGMARRMKQTVPKIDFTRALMVGDSEGDMEFGRRIGATSIRIVPLRGEPYGFLSLEMFARLVCGA